MQKQKGVKIVAENVLEDSKSDLSESLHFSVENVGKADAELVFDESGTRVELPAGTKREFPFVGDRYTGRLSVFFKKASTGSKRVTIVKLTHHC